MDEAEFQNVITFEHSNMKHFFLLPLLKSQNLSLPFAFDSGSKLILRVKKKKQKMKQEETTNVTMSFNSADF